MVWAPACRQGQEEFELPIPSKCKGSIRFNYNILVRTITTKIGATRHLSWAQNIYLNEFAAGAHVGTYTYRALPNPIIDLMGPLCGGKGRGEQDEEGVENRREGKRNREMEEKKERREMKGMGFTLPPLQEFLRAPTFTCCTCEWNDNHKNVLRELKLLLRQGSCIVRESRETVGV